MHAIAGGAAAGVDLLTWTNLGEDETRYWALYSPVFLILGPAPYVFLVPYLGNAVQATGEPFVYPAKGQSPEQTEKDKFD